MATAITLTFGAFAGGKTAGGNDLALQAYNVPGATYINFIVSHNHHVVFDHPVLVDATGDSTDLTLTGTCRYQGGGADFVCQLHDGGVTGDTFEVTLHQGGVEVFSDFSDQTHGLTYVTIKTY